MARRTSFRKDDGAARPVRSEKSGRRQVVREDDRSRWDPVEEAPVERVEHAIPQVLEIGRPGAEIVVVARRVAGDLPDRARRARPGPPARRRRSPRRRRSRASRLPAWRSGIRGSPPRCSRPARRAASGNRPPVRIAARNAASSPAGIAGARDALRTAARRTTGPRANPGEAGRPTSRHGGHRRHSSSNLRRTRSITAATAAGASSPSARTWRTVSPGSLHAHDLDRALRIGPRPVRRESAVRHSPGTPWRAW